MKKETDSNIFEAWERRWEGSPRRKHISPLGRQMFNAKKKILARILTEIEIDTAIDVGCGLGFVLEVYRDHGVEYIGIDVSSNAVSFCTRKKLNVVKKKMDEVDTQYDLVSSDGMLEHFLHFEPYAEQMMELSRKYILLIQPNHNSFLGRTLAYLAGIFGDRKNVYEYNYRIEDFVDVFEKGEFGLFKSFPVYLDVFRLLLFKKKLSEKK
ncbi:class I SAM-dependent methyltransferase [Acidobacteriota bacterium]